MSNDLIRRRQLLGKDEKWIEDILGQYSGSSLSPAIHCRQSMIDRRKAAEGTFPDSCYSTNEVSKLQKVYDKALTALELPVAPVCPENVTAWRSHNAGTYMHAATTCGPTGAFLEVCRSGVILKVPGHVDALCSPELLEYAAKLSRYYTQLNKRDAVKSAEEKLNRTAAAHQEAIAAYEKARKEADLE